MSKKITATMLVFGTLTAGLVFGVSVRANAQTVSSTNSTTTSTTLSSTTTTTVPTTTTTTVTASSPLVPLPAGFLQLDGLTVVSVSPAGISPMQIVATAPAGGANCTQFASDTATTGTSVTCPVAAQTATPTSTASSSAYYNPYVIVLDAASTVLTSNRLAASFTQIAPGNTINVYGYYDGIGTLDAEIVRDLSWSSTGATTGTAGTGITTVSALQTEINQLEALVAQLAGELGMSTTTASSTITVSSTLPVSCPMIPAGATSTAGCPPASSTTSTASTTIIY